MPSLIGVDPSGQAIAIAGHATGLLGSQIGFAGTHWPVHVCPLQLPFASHMQLGSVAGQAHGGTGGTLVPPMPVVGSGGGVPVLVLPVPPLVVGVPPPPQPQPLHDTWHIWPVGQSVSTLQPAWMLGTQTP